MSQTPDVLPARIQPILLVGGAGARLAPLSTPICPKPFMPLPGGSLFARTLVRLPVGWQDPIIVAHYTHATHLESVKAREILLEPESRNTAMAMAVAVAWMMAQGAGDQVVVMLPADHAMADVAAWHEALARATAIACAREVMVLLAMVPRAPSSDLGYMHIDGARVVTFHEKPENAEALLAQGWMANSGQLVARARVVAEALAQHAPEVWHAAQAAVEKAPLVDQPSPPYAQRLRGARPQPSPRGGEGVMNPTLLPVHHYHPLLLIPFDRAVLEKADNLAAVACACGWADIGTLAALAEYVMPHTGAVLARRDAPWGDAETLASEDGVAVKRLHITPEHRTSLQRHVKRAELWRVEQGQAEITLDGKTYALGTGAVMAIAAGSWHRIANTGSEMLILSELQIGAPDEEDIERLEDDYGRV